MDDNIKNSSGNQSTAPSPQPQTETPNSATPLPPEGSAPPQPNTPIYESVPVEENFQPEEVAPDIASPTTEDVGSSVPPEIPPTPPMFEENKKQYLMIAGGAVVFILILIVIVKMLFGTKTTPKATKLTYWGLWEEKEVLDPLIKQYQKSNPHISIDYQKMSVQEYRDRLVARSIKGMGPDIFRFHNTWLPEIKDIVTPLPEKIMTAAEFEKTFYKIHQQDLKVGNYYYGLPLMIDGLVLIYNDSLLKKAGIDAVPTNWDEITEAVTKLAVKDTTGQIITAGIALGTGTNVEHFSDIFGLMLIQNGGTLTGLEKTEAAGALESYRKFAESPNDFWNENMPNSTTAFIQEKVAMIIAPSWELLTIKAINPDLDVKVAPVPSVPGGKSVSIASYWVEGVSRYSKNQTEAWKFVKYLTEKDNMTKLYQIESQLRPFGEAYSRVDLAPLLAQNQYLGAVIKQADDYVSLPLASRTFDNGLNDEIIKYIENAINATSQGVSYSQALETAKKGVDQVLLKYQIK